MTRFIAWLAVGMAGAFLLVANVAFAQSTTVWLAFGIAIGTLIVSACLAYAYRDNATTMASALLCVVVSMWTIVASRVFTGATLDHLILASSLALSAIAVLGLTTHEIDVERVAHGADAGDGRSKLAAAA
jgi:FtsH-binding integral membrane protein